MNILYTYLEN